MKLAIIGSRSFRNYELLKKVYDVFFARYTVTKIVSGGAQGADKLGAQLARELNIELLEFVPDWNKHGKKAGYLRNIDIVNNSDMLLAMWDGISTGTNHSITIAKEQRKPTLIWYI